MRERSAGATARPGRDISRGGSVRGTLRRRPAEIQPAAVSAMARPRPTGGHASSRRTSARVARPVHRALSGGWWSRRTSSWPFAMNALTTSAWA